MSEDKDFTEVEIAGGSRIDDPDEMDRIISLVAKDGVDIVCFVYDEQTQSWCIATGNGTDYGAVYTLNPGCLLITILETITRDSQRPVGVDAEETAIVPDGADSFSGSLMFVRKGDGDIAEFIEEEFGNE